MPVQGKQNSQNHKAPPALTIGANTVTFSSVAEKYSLKSQGFIYHPIDVFEAKLRAAVDEMDHIEGSAELWKATEKGKLNDSMHSCSTLSSFSLCSREPSNVNIFPLVSLPNSKPLIDHRTSNLNMSPSQVASGANNPSKTKVSDQWCAIGVTKAYAKLRYYN